MEQEIHTSELMHVIRRAMLSGVRKGFIGFDEIEDLEQELFLKLIRRSGVRVVQDINMVILPADIIKPGGWAVRSAHNLIVEKSKKRDRRNERELLNCEFKLDADGGDAESVQAMIDLSIIIKHIPSAINASQNPKIPEDDREAMSLGVFEYIILSADSDRCQAEAYRAYENVSKDPCKIDTFRTRLANVMKILTRIGG